MRTKILLAAIISVLSCCRVAAHQSPASPATSGAASPSAAAKSDADLWKSVEHSTDPADFKSYLMQYPDGDHAAEATARLESYAVGLNIGVAFSKQAMDLDMPSLERGLQDKFSGAKAQMTDEEVAVALAELQAKAKEQQLPMRAQAGEKDSYALGMNIAKGLMHQSVDVDAASLARGMQDILTDKPPLLTAEEAQDAIADLQLRSSARMDGQRAAEADANRKTGTEFLAKNKNEPGVVTLPSGLQYRILTIGTGPKPAPSDTVVCEYRGTLIDGTEFDSSDKRGAPMLSRVSDLMPGWSEALQRMPVGSTWRLFIPSDLAYGAAGSGSDVGANATIILEVQLLSIQRQR